jgi:hypothetical protein
MDQKIHRKNKPSLQFYYLPGKSRMELASTSSKANNNEFQKKQSGFVVVLFLIALPFLISILFATQSSLMIIKERRTIQYDCQQELAKGLKRAGKLMQALLAYNPLALNLKIRTNHLQMMLAVALARGDLPSSALLTKQLKVVWAQRKKLHAQQMNLYRAAQLELQTSQMYTQSRIRGQFLAVLALPYKLTNPAIEPMDKEIGTVWRKKLNFEEVQSMNQGWTWRFQEPFQITKFFKFKFQREEQCSLTINSDTPQWTLQIAG